MERDKEEERQGKEDSWGTWHALFHGSTCFTGMPQSAT